MNNLTQFTNKENLKLLWDVLLDELHINNTNKIRINNIKTVFESNINLFTSRANSRLNIMELNKQFLSQVVLAVNRLFPTIKDDQSIKRITISNEEISEPYKIEDIHASRQNDFEKEVENKRIEMNNYMTLQKPIDLDFSDKYSDGKITAMDSLISEKMAQRNSEIEQMQNNNNNTSSLELEKWLTPKKTSIKNDKTVVNKSILVNGSENSKLKHISIDNNNNITLTVNENVDKIKDSMKKVSWDNSQDTSINIFSKLKKQPIIDENINDFSDNNVDNVNKSYQEQKSMQLPEVKQEEIIRNKVTLPTSNNEPILPKTEIIKQLNEMNKKIDNLYEMVFKLTTIFEKDTLKEFP